MRSRVRAQHTKSLDINSGPPVLCPRRSQTQNTGGTNHVFVIIRFFGFFSAGTSAIKAWDDQV